MIILIVIIRTIALNVYRKPFAELLTFSHRIAKGLNAQAADYPNPPVSIATMDDDNDALEAAINAWGQPGNRGSHLDYKKLLQARIVVKENLKTNSNYVMGATPNNSAKWEAVGFVTKKGKTPKLKMDAVRNLQQVFSRNISKGDVSLRWQRPQNARHNERINYTVFRANTATEKPKYIGSSTRTRFTDSTGNGRTYYYYIVPDNAFGKGVISGACQATAVFPGA